MDNSKRTSLVFIIFWITIFSTHTIFTCADQGQNDVKTSQESPSPQEILFDTYTLFTKASLQYWESVKNLFNQAQLRFSASPPDNLDFKSKDDGGDEVGAKERLKDAAEKSFEQTKEAVEGSAKTAADAVHDAAEKVKDKMPAGKDAAAAAAADHGEL